MSDWPDALDEARFLLGAVSGTALAEPVVWARLESALADLESALDGGDLGRVRLVLYTLEDTLAGDRMRMLGGPDDRTPPPPALTDRLDELVTRIRVTGAGHPGGAPHPTGTHEPADPTGSPTGDAT